MKILELISDVYLAANLLFIPVIFYFILVGCNKILKEQSKIQIPSEDEIVDEYYSEDEAEEVWTK